MPISRVVTRGYGSFGSVASVVSRGYAAQLADALLAQSIAAGTPTVGAPAIGQEHELVAPAIAAGTPTVGAPQLGQEHQLVAAGIAAGVPSVGAPKVGFGEPDALRALGIAAAIPTVGAPALTSQRPYFTILPPNATGFERSLEYPQRRLMDLPVPIRDVWRWDKCPVDLLPWLAWAMSVDIWDPDWPETKKRAIIRDSFELHRRKGTLWCIERYLSFAGAKLIKAIVPPNKAFPGTSMTPTERQAWLNRFPQIRVFRFRDRGVQTYGAFASRGSFKLNKTFLGAGPAHVPPETGTATVPTFFPYQTDAAARWGRRAFLWDKGAHFLASGLETPLTTVQRSTVEHDGVAVDYEQVLVPGSAVQSLFLGAFAKGNHIGPNGRKDGRLFPVASTAPTRIVSLRREHEYTAEADVLRQFTLRPSLQPILAFPEHVAEAGTSKAGIQVFGGLPGRWLDPETLTRKRVKSFLVGYMPETSSPQRLFDRLYLHDPARLPNGRPPSIYMGNFRLGQPPFTAELSVQVTGRRSNYEFGRFVYGHLTTGDRGPLNLVRKAVQRSKAHRDKILIKTQLHRPVTTADGITTDASARSGDLVMAA
jgi:hypothetical protein